MGASDDERIADLEARPWLDDPRFARGPGRSRPRRSREYRRGRARLAMAVALAAIVAGVLVPHGLLLAAGLVTAGVALNLLDTRRHHPHRRGRQVPSDD